MRLLHNEKMISLSKNWTVNRRRELEAIPQVAGILPDIEAAHNRLLRIVESPVPPQDPTDVLNKRIRKRDKRHDNLLRAGYFHLCSLIAFFVANEDEANEDATIALRKVLYPKELTGTMIGYDEQEGLALLVENALVDSVKQQAKSIRFMVGNREYNLLELVQEQISIAKEVMDCVREKKKLESVSTTTPFEERNARNSWIEAARTLISNLRLAVRNGSATQEIMNSLLQELTEAEAEERKEREAKKAESAATDKPIVP